MIIVQLNVTRAAGTRGNDRGTGGGGGGEGEGGMETNYLDQPAAIKCGWRVRDPVPLQAGGFYRLSAAGTQPPREMETAPV